MIDFKNRSREMNTEDLMKIALLLTIFCLHPVFNVSFFLCCRHVRKHHKNNGYDNSGIHVSNMFMKKTSPG